MTLPETRYARNNGLHVAYQLVGDGPVDVVLPWGFDAGNFDMVMERTRRTWGKGMLLRQFAPRLLADAALVELESRYERQAASPGTAMTMTRMINLIDVRSVLPTITVPTMVISRADPAAVPAGHRRSIADHARARGTWSLPGRMS